MKKRKIIILAALLVILLLVLYVQSFDLKTIKVVGTEATTPEMIEQAVKEYAPLNNTLLLWTKERFQPLEDIPFVSKVDIDIDSKNQITVTVYEKSLAGCVEYMNGYVFFDKDGIILDAGDKLIAGVPCIRGLTFDSWEMGERLPITDRSKFNSILSITQLVEKYKLNIDGIRFTPEDEIVLMRGNIDIELGAGDNLPVQMMNLSAILDGLGDMEGVLYMKDFNSENETASFSKK